MPKEEFVVSPDERESTRLDLFLASRLSGLSRSRIGRLIQEGGVLVDGIKRKPSSKLRGGERIVVTYEVSSEDDLEAELPSFDIIHTDEDIAVVNKPSGLVVHPGSGVRNHTLVNGLLGLFPQIREVGAAARPGIVHRLDKETSGVMVTALTPEAFEDLKRQFKDRTVEKHYTGLVWGRILSENGVIDRPIGRHVKHGERISVRTRRPRPAVTRFRVEKTFPDFTLLDLQPVTGRTHQIRVHLAASGHPVVGDMRYGRKKTRCPRLFLHARAISFTHPRTGERISFSAPLPQELCSFLESLESGP